METKDMKLRSGFVEKNKEWGEREKRIMMCKNNWNSWHKETAKNVK